MDTKEILLSRYNVLHDHYLEQVWAVVPEDLMRQRPHPRVNSVAWNLWHVARVEDAGLNSFVADRAQVFDTGDWLPRLKLPWRHQGTGMTYAEVDELDRRIDLQALRAYAGAVQAASQAILESLDLAALDEVMGAERLRVIIIDEGLAAPQATGLLDNYLGWKKGRCLLHFGLTHTFQHVGEIGVIASLLGLDY